MWSVWHELETVFCLLLCYVARLAFVVLVVPMTPEERQALREKHVRHHKAENYCLGCGGYVKGDVCDTILVLNELDKAWKGLDILADAGLAAVGAFKELASQTCEHLPYYGTCYRCGEDLPKVTECDH